MTNRRAQGQRSLGLKVYCGNVQMDRDNNALGLHTMLNTNHISYLLNVG